MRGLGLQQRTLTGGEGAGLCAMHVGHRRCVCGGGTWAGSHTIHQVSGLGFKRGLTTGAPTPASSQLPASPLPKISPEVLAANMDS